jgi:hypothetical protein
VGATVTATTIAGVEALVAELHREAATALAQAVRCPKHLRHDARIYKERAAVALEAVTYLEEALLA